MRRTVEELNEALKHLEEAQETLTHAEDKLTDHTAGDAIVSAVQSTREALQLLEDVKEETCEKS